MNEKEHGANVEVLRELPFGTESQLRVFLRAIEHGPMGVMITGLDGTIEYVNPKIEEITGYSVVEMIGRNPRLLQSGETSPAQYEELWQTITAGREWRGVFYNRRKTGEHYWERDIISPVTDAAGTFSHYVAIKEDVTELRRIEKEVEEQRLKYFHQSKMADVGMLAASILHEVTSPVAAIHGVTSALLKTSTDTMNRQQLEIVLDLANRLTGITQEIAEFTSPIPDKRELIDVNSIIRSTCHLVRFDKRWQSISLALDLDSQIPAVMGYKDQMSHLIVNLLVNAADAVAERPAEKSQVSIRTETSARRLLITVEDNGVGMTPEVAAHATEAFFTTKRPGKGTGLGLSLCDSIVKSHHGELTIRSVPGVGTAMIVSLPIEET